MSCQELTWCRRCPWHHNQVRCWRVFDVTNATWNINIEDLFGDFNLLLWNAQNIFINVVINYHFILITSTCSLLMYKLICWCLLLFPFTNAFIDHALVQARPFAHWVTSVNAHVHKTDTASWTHPLRPTPWYPSPHPPLFRYAWNQPQQSPPPTQTRHKHTDPKTHGSPGGSSPCSLIFGTSRLSGLKYFCATSMFLRRSDAH